MVSACLLGLSCRYDGKNRTDKALMKKLKGQCIIPVCPEQLGGLSTPRYAAEIAGGDGFDVLEGTARVVLKQTSHEDRGTDVTARFVAGALECAMIAKLTGAECCYLKARSPSCGTGPVTGVTAAKLILMGLKITEAGL